MTEASPSAPADSAATGPGFVHLRLRSPSIRSRTRSCASTRRSPPRSPTAARAGADRFGEPVRLGAFLQDRAGKRRAANLRRRRVDYQPRRSRAPAPPAADRGERRRLSQSVRAAVARLARERASRSRRDRSGLVHADNRRGPDRAVGRAGGRGRPVARAGNQRRRKGGRRAAGGAPFRRRSTSRCSAHRLARCGGAVARESARLAAASCGLPLVATHPIQFIARDDYRAHEARVCIAEGEILGNPRRVRRYTEEQYFLSRAEMAERFADLPSALSNSVEIARRCHLSMTLGESRLPELPDARGDERR